MPNKVKTGNKWEFKNEIQEMALRLGNMGDLLHIQN